MRLLFFIVTILSFLPFYGHQDQEVFLCANRSYQEGDYVKALEQYKQVNNKGALTLYNMGNAAYCNEYYCQALIYWLKSQKNSTAYICMCSQDNIVRMQRALHKKIDSSLMSFFKKKIVSFPLLLVQLFFLFFWFSYWLLGSCRKKTRLVCLCISLVLGFIITLQYIFRFTSVGVVQKKTAIFTGPDEQYHSLAQLEKADQVIIKAEHNQWYKVSYNKQTGWIPKSNITVV